MLRPKSVKFEKSKLRLGQIFYLSTCATTASWRVLRVKVIDMLQHDPERVRVSFLNPLYEDADVRLDCLSDLENSGGGNYTWKLRGLVNPRGKGYSMKQVADRSRATPRRMRHLRRASDAYREETDSSADQADC